MDEKQLRSVIRQVLREAPMSFDTLLEYDDYGGRYSGLFKALSEPFIDVAKSVKLTSQDLLNSFKLIFKTLTTLSPEKLVRARENYKRTASALSKEWEPLMKKAREAVDRSDFGLVTFALAPQLFFGYQIGKFAVDAPSTVADYFEKAGWDVPFKSMRSSDRISGSSTSTDRDRGGASRSSDSGGISKRLRVFFFGEAATREVSGGIITEAADETEDSEVLSKRNIGTEINKYFKETGFDKTLGELTDQFIAAKKEHADTLLTAARDQINTLKSFSSAADLAEFEKALSAAKSSGADVDAIQQKLDELKKDLEKKSSELKKDKKFKEELIKKVGKKEKKPSDADISRAADSAAVEASRQALAEIKRGISESLQAALEEIKGQIRDELTEDMPSKDDPFHKAIMSTSRGKELMDVINKAVDSVGASSE